jgi:hypothetical protein
MCVFGSLKAVVREAKHGSREGPRINTFDDSRQTGFRVFRHQSRFLPPTGKIVLR